MKEQFEAVCPTEFVLGDIDEARKTASGNSCKTKNAI